MQRHLGIAVIATLAWVGCDRKAKDSKKDPASATSSAAPVADKAAVPAPPASTPPATPASTPPTPAAPVAPAAPAEDRVLATGVLDLELVEHGKMFVLRDDALEVAFPLRPNVEGSDQVAPNGVKMRAATAFATSDSDMYGLFLIPVPKGVPYDVKKGLDGARDGALKNVNGKLAGEVVTKFGGLTGRKSTATAAIGGKDVKIDLYLAYDKDHHMVVGLFLGTTQAAMPSEAGSFVASFKVNPDGKAPPAGNGK